MTSPAVGFKKIAFSPRLTGMAVGGLMGAAATPEDQTATGALAGAGMGYAAGAIGSHLHQRFAGPKPAAAPAAPVALGAPVAPPAPANTFFTPDAIAARRKARGSPMAAGPVVQEGVGEARPVAKAAPPAPAAPAARRKTKARSQEAAAPPLDPLQQIHAAQTEQATANAATPVKGTRATKPTPRRVKKSHLVGFAKLSEHSVSFSPQGASMGLSSKDERLDGMNRWVPRHTLEQAFEGVDAGYDEQALTEQAANEGHIAHPAIGAALGAALAHYGIPASMGAKVIGGLAGAGMGAMYNHATADGRASDMQEALKGVRKERGTSNTAREATPMVVSAAGGNA